MAGPKSRCADWLRLADAPNKHQQFIIGGHCKIVPELQANGLGQLRQGFNISDAHVGCLGFQRLIKRLVALAGVPALMLERPVQTERTVLLKAGADTLRRTALRTSLERDLDIGNF